MSEHDAATGQFTSAEPLYGLAGIEQDAGYTPMPEREPKEDAEAELTIEEAAQALRDRQQSEPPSATVRTYFDGNDFAGEHETITLERAARDLSEVQAEEAAEREEADMEKVRAEVDRLRGVEPEAKIKPAATAKDEAVADGVDPDLAEVERALNNPKVKAAIQQQIGETEQARQAHINGLAAATTIATSALMSQFPELANVAVEQYGAVFAQIQQQNPGRARQMLSIAGNLQGLVQQHATALQHSEQVEQGKFQTFVKSEGARFEAMIKGDSKETRRAVENSIVEAIKEYGGDESEFFELLKTSKFMNSAVAQRILWDAGKYRQGQKAAAAAKANLVARAVPPVQRPGSAAARSQGSAPDLSALDRKLSASGGLKEATALYLAQQSRKRG